jgi:hypothetical protein
MGKKIHTLDNLLTLDPSFHNWFDSLELWFEEVVSDLSSSFLVLVRTMFACCKPQQGTLPSTRP